MWPGHTLLLKSIKGPGPQSSSLLKYPFVQSQVSVSLSPSLSFPLSLSPSTCYVQICLLCTLHVMESYMWPFVFDSFHLASCLQSLSM